MSGLGVAGEVRKVVGGGGGRGPSLGSEQKLTGPGLCFNRLYCPPPLVWGVNKQRGRGGNRETG